MIKSLKYYETSEGQKKYTEYHNQVLKDFFKYYNQYLKEGNKINDEYKIFYEIQENCMMQCIDYTEDAIYPMFEALRIELNII